MHAYISEVQTHLGNTLKQHIVRMSTTLTWYKTEEQDIDTMSTKDMSDESLGMMSKDTTASHARRPRA